MMDIDALFTVVPLMASSLAVFVHVLVNAIKAARLVPSRFLPLTACGVGVLLSVPTAFALFGLTSEGALIGLFSGLMAGAGAVGLTEMHKQARKPTGKELQEILRREDRP